MAVTAGFMVPHPPLIVPAIGKGEEQTITDTQEAYRRAAEEIAALRPETIVVLSPHTVIMRIIFMWPQVIGRREISDSSGRGR